MNCSRRYRVGGGTRPVAANKIIVQLASLACLAMASGCIYCVDLISQPIVKILGIDNSGDILRIHDVMAVGYCDPMVDVDGHDNIYSTALEVNIREQTSKVVEQQRGDEEALLAWPETGFSKLFEGRFSDMTCTDCRLDIYDESTNLHINLLTGKRIEEEVPGVFATTAILVQGEEAETAFFALQMDDAVFYQ